MRHSILPGIIPYRPTPSLFYTSRLPKNERIEGIFVFSGGSELKTIFKNSKSKLKNLKHSAVNVLFWAYPMIQL
jgi:hypothetical protein